MTTRTITVEALAAALQATNPPTSPDEGWAPWAAAIFAALPAEPEYSGFGEREGKRFGISRHNPFADRINVIADTPQAEPAGAGLREAAEAVADELGILQSVYHAVTQGFPNRTRAECEAGLCGTYRSMRDRLRAALAATPVGEDG